MLPDIPAPFPLKSAITGTSTSLLTCQYADIVDSSTNVYAITNVGSAKTYLTDKFSGIVSGVNYSQKNYSLKINEPQTATRQYVTIASNAALTFGTGDFTVEAWVLCTGNRALALNGADDTQFIVCDNSINSTGFSLAMMADGIITTNPGYGQTSYFVPSGGTTGTRYFQYNTWYHIAYQRISGTHSCYINGVAATVSGSVNNLNYTTTSMGIGGSAIGALRYDLTGYISNLRITKALAVYTGAFTPSTTPLKAAQSSGTNIAAITTQTSLLTCQYNTLFDASTNKLALTRIGAPDMVNMYPFPT